MKRLLAAVAALALLSSPAFAQTGGVRGKILDDKGAPLEGVDVTMEFQGGVTMSFETKTNKKGEFVQIGLRPGTWKFTYKKEGYGPFVSPYRISLGEATILPEMKLVSANGAASGGGGADDIQKSFAAAVAKLQGGDLDGAVADFDAIIVNHPSLPEAYYNKAFALSRKKDYTAAEAALNRALEVKADYADARILLSNIYTAQGMNDKAVEVLSGGASGDDPKQLFNLGLTLLNSGKNDEATAAFLKTEAADPKHAEAQYYLAIAALNGGKTEECVTRLEKYLQLGPQDEKNKSAATNLLGALKKQ